MFINFLTRVAARGISN